MHLNQTMSNQAADGRDESTRLTDTLHNAVLLTLLLLALAAVLSPETAFAQGQGETVVTYVINEYGKPMLNMAIVAVGVFMFFLRFSFPIIGTVAGGGLTFANYSQIAGLFGA
jgi:hypothetical protein